MGNEPSMLARRLTLIAMSLGFGIVQLDVTIVNTALSSIETSLGGGVAELQWVVSAYTIAFAALILTAGALGDRLGAKKIFTLGFGIFTAASLACALSPTTLLLVGARVVQGAGAAILVPNSLALLNHAYPEDKERGRAVGFWAAGASLALTAGPLAGGVLISLVGWRSIFLVNLPIGLAGLWLTWRYTSETKLSSQRELDLPGQGAAIGALGILTAVIIDGGMLGRTNPWVVSGYVMTLLCALGFVLRELRAEQPMLPLSLFGERLFSLTALVGLLANIAFYGLIFVLSLYFQQINGLSPLQTGLAFLPMMGVVLPANLYAARLAEQFGAISVIAAGAAIAAIGCFALVHIEHGTSYAILCGPLVAMGAGLGLLVPPLTSTLLGSVEKSRSGVAAGVLNATRQTGSAIGVAAFGSLINDAHGFIWGARLSAVIATIVLLSAAVVLILFGKHPRKAAPAAR